jgi:diaminopimelate epimerase
MEMAEALPQPVARGEGLGNSFLIFEELSQSQVALLQSAADPLCGRNYDGLLVVQNPQSDPASSGGSSASQSTLAVQVINRDGSDGGICLNGLRVVAMWTGEAEGVLCMAGKHVPWRRMAMPAVLQPMPSVNGLGETERLGNGLNAAEQIELHLPAECLTASLWQPKPMEVLGQPAWAVDFWNPHCVIETSEPKSAHLPAFARAARERTDLFPKGVNVEVVRFADAKMRVDERGVGETQACGSGAVAAAVAIWSKDRALGVGQPGSAASAAEERQNGPLTVQMPGGNLTIERSADGGIRLTGGATVTGFGGN